MTNEKKVRAIFKRNSSGIFEQVESAKLLPKEEIFILPTDQGLILFVGLIYDEDKAIFARVFEDLETNEKNKG